MRRVTNDGTRTRSVHSSSFGVRLQRVLAVLALGACNVPEPADSVDAGAVAAGGVDAALSVDTDVHHVEAIVESGFKAPDRHTLAVRFVSDATEPQFVEWARQYDGVDMATQVMSVHTPSGWQVRWHHELAEPEPVRTSEVISFAQAAENVGLGDAFARREIKAQLLYRPRFRVLPGATDGELVVESYQLVVELKSTTRRTFVDAYTGRLVDEISEQTTFENEVDNPRQVQTMRLGWVTINASRYATKWRVINGETVPVAWSPAYYKDLTRASLTSPVGDGFIDGAGFSTNKTSPHAYAPVVVTADYKNDIVFALQESWASTCNASVAADYGICNRR